MSLANLDEEERHDVVLDACTLIADSGVSKNQEANEIGKYGLTFSGGQEACIVIAHTVYPRTETPLDGFLIRRCAHAVKHLFARYLKERPTQDPILVPVRHGVRLCEGGTGKERMDAEYGQARR